MKLTLAVAQQNAVAQQPRPPDLSTEDNKWINSRAAEMATATPRERMSEIVGEMDPRVRQSLMEKQIDPIINNPLDLNNNIIDNLRRQPPWPPLLLPLRAHPNPKRKWRPSSPVHTHHEHDIRLPAAGHTHHSEEED